MKIHLAILGVILLLGTACTPEKDIRPNVLFISFDDLNDWTGCLSGHPQSITPNIDRLAARGVLFTNAHCTGTMCCPSRASVITGLRPTTTGVYKNSDTPLDLYRDKQTLNRHFMESGYFVAGAGKILHKFYYEEDQWHEFVRRHLEENVIGHREYPGEDSEITRVSGNIAWGTFSSPDSLTFDGRTADWISERIMRDHDKPFFLACGIFRPHIPWFNPEKYVDLYPLDEVELPLVKDDDLDDVPLPGKNIAYSITNFTKEGDLNSADENREHEIIKNDGLWDEAVRAYLASVSYADAQLGRLLDVLENSPYADNTIIVLWSDHGWHLGEKEHWRKATLWEQVTRVPLIIYAPGLSGQGMCRQPVSLLDLYPTLVELCILPEVEGLEGESLVPQLIDPGKPRLIPAITSITPEYHSVRDLRYRYISYGDGREELYDHDLDPEEWKNLADDPEFKIIKEGLSAFIPQNNAAPVQGLYAD